MLNDFSEYLDYKNYKFTKKLVDKLVERNSVENKCKHNSYTLYIVLFSILSTINVGTGLYFLNFHWYLNKRCYSC